MASPFAVFRKYQAILLAVFGVIIILLFTVGDPLMQITARPKIEDPVAVTFAGGELTEHQLQSQIHARRAAASLLARLRFPAQYPQYPENIRSRLPLDTRGLVLTDENVTPEATVRSMLLARKAEELGMRVSSDEVREYLRSTVALDTVSIPQIREMIEGTKEDRTNYTVDQMLEPVRQEMLARQLYDFLARGLMAMPPAEQFAYYSRIYQKAAADIVAIPVDEFVGKVKEPTEEELAAYFDRYKEKLPKLEMQGGTPLPSAEPGFKLPHRAKVQYLKAKFDDFVDRARPEVTDEEIAKYYEENKQEFQQQDLPLINEEKESAGKKPGTTATGQGTDPASPTKAAIQGSGSEPASATQSPTIRPQPGTQALADEKDSGKQAGNADVKKKDVPKSNEARTRPATEGTSPATTQAAAQGTGAPEKPAPKYKPFAEVKDDIHKQLAGQKAAEKIDEIFRQIRKELEENIQFRLRIARDPGSRGKKLPALTDFSTLAKQHNLTAHTTGLLSAQQMVDEPEIGKSFDPESGQPYVALVYSNKGEHSLHQVLTTVDGDRNRYISWKLADEPEEVPKLEGAVREDVVRQWKRGQGLEVVTGKAQGLALAAAEQVAERLRKGEPIGDAAKGVPGAKVVEVDPFSWLTYGELRSRLEPPSGPPRLSKIEGIEDAGPEFMEKVFSLKPGDVAVAPNHTRSYVHVIQLKNQETAPRVIQESFVADMTSQVNRMEVGQATQIEMGELSRRLIEKLEEDYRLKWVIQPAEIASR